jgi:hypothetical protein
MMSGESTLATHHPSFTTMPVLERTEASEERPIDIMRERILPTTFAAALFLSVAVFEVGPQAAPQQPSTPISTPTSTAAIRPEILVPQKPPAPKLAKYEPARGAYLGAALDFSKLQSVGTRVGPMADLMGAWEKQSWRENAIYVGFHPFPHEDGSFPSWDFDPKGWTSIGDFFNACAALDAAPLLTLEPLKPRVFVDDWQESSAAYQSTRTLAMQIGGWNKPAFIRFAHEMNGSWYPWAEWADKNRNLKRDPGEDTGFYAKDYKVAYRNVAALFRKYAPNVALVWCPNSGLLGGERRDVFAPWYPGDEFVDWVGLDVYDRGWTMPMPGAHLWGGQFAYNLTRDMADDTSTPDKNESVNFYETYTVGKNKPLMLCETGATLSFRTDLGKPERARLNHEWKAGNWNNAEYGWMQGVYGTSAFKDQKLLQPIDLAFPKLKAIAWFQIGKREYIPVEKTVGGKKEVVWFDDSWADYRIGSGADENETSSPFSQEELSLYRRLTNTNYFLSKIVN